MYTYINVRTVQGLGQLVLYRRNDGKYIISVFSADSRSSIDYEFKYRSLAVAWRENQRKH